MIKLVALLKRRQGMSKAEFISYYEDKHVKLADEILRGNCVRYLRRYLSPMAHPLSGEVDRPPFDVLMEMWFEDPQQMQSTLGLFAAPGTSEVFSADEKRVFDVAQTLVFTAEEHESDLRGAGRTEALGKL